MKICMFYIRITHKHNIRKVKLILALYIVFMLFILFIFFILLVVKLNLTLIIKKELKHW